MDDLVISYVKNAFLGFQIPYVKEGVEKQYLPDFIARCKGKGDKVFNLIIEIAGDIRNIKNQLREKIQEVNSG